MQVPRVLKRLSKGGCGMRGVLRASFSRARPANKSARGETSTEYVFAFVVVAIVVFATYLSLLNI